MTRKTGKIAGTIENLGGRTEHLASDEAGHVFLNMQDRNTTLKLDAKNLKLLETWPTAPCEAPSSMDMDRAHSRIIIGCRGAGTMAAMDAASGKIVCQQSHWRRRGCGGIRSEDRAGLLLDRRGRRALDFPGKIRRTSLT